jgi:hypothetical protein
MCADSTGKRSNNKLYGWLRRRTSKFRKGIAKSSEHKAKIGNADRGRKQSPDHIKKRTESYLSGLIRKSKEDKILLTDEEIFLKMKRKWENYDIKLQLKKDNLQITAILYSLT